MPLPTSSRYKLVCFCVTRVNYVLQFHVTVVITVISLIFATAAARIDGVPVLGVVQLMWINLVFDPLAALALATDAPSSNVLYKRPSRESSKI